MTYFKWQNKIYKALYTTDLQYFSNLSVCQKLIKVLLKEMCCSPSPKFCFSWFVDGEHELAFLASSHLILMVLEPPATYVNYCCRKFSKQKGHILFFQK